MLHITHAPNLFLIWVLWTSYYTYFILAMFTDTLLSTCTEGQCPPGVGAASQHPGGGVSGTQLPPHHRPAAPHTRGHQEVRLSSLPAEIKTQESPSTQCQLGAAGAQRLAASDCGDGGVPFGKDFYPYLLTRVHQWVPSSAIGVGGGRGRGRRIPVPY